MRNKYDLPSLRGEDNEYGDYDYLAQDLPSPVSHLVLRPYPSRCDCCGKQARLYRYSSSSFYTLDGYDSLDYNECWRCILKARVYSLLNSIKKAIKRQGDAVNLAGCSTKEKRFATYYKLVSKSCKILG